MKRKQQNKKIVAWFLTATLCFSSFWGWGDVRMTQAEERDAGENIRTLSCPVIDAEEGKIIWDSIYFGNYWQKVFYGKQCDNQGIEEKENLLFPCAGI